MSDELSSKWLYYKIYLGAWAPKTEHFVLGALQRISELEALSRWYFVHHTDAGGPHLRVRLEATGDVRALQRAVDPILYEVLAELPASPPSPYRRMIFSQLHASESGTPPTEHLQGSRVEVERYQPDVDTFGESGVVLAEELFCASSQIALRSLADERDQKYSRKTVAPLLMRATGDAFVGSADQSIWRDYATYWLDCTPGRGAEWRPRFLSKARDLCAQNVSVLPGDEHLPREAAAVVQAWRSTTLSAAEAFRTVCDEPARRPVDLAFHFIHLMNNRLSLMPIEEAYLATLIAAAIGEETAA